MMIWDYVFVGAGPASLAAASQIAQTNGARVKIFDAGRGLHQRGCPGLKESSCVSCAGEICHVTQGMGGSSAIFGNKFCYFPASSGVAEYIDNRDLQSVEDYVLGIIGENPGTANNVIALNSSPQRKVYSADVAYRGDYRRIITKLTDQALRLCSVNLETQVNEMRHSRGMIEITTNAGEAMLARHVVIGTGRSSKKTVGWFEALGCDVEVNSADVGFRIEADSDSFHPSFFYQNDPKYKFTLPGIGSSRTFCACRGGAIIPVKYGESFFADGAFLNTDTGRTNVALMVRSAVAPSELEISTWMRDINAFAGGTLALGEVSLEGEPAEVASKIANLMPQWPTETHRMLAFDLIDKMIGGNFVQAFKRTSGKAKVYGPSIDLYWPRVSLTKGFRTTAENVSVIGDATGVSRGILQAMTSGIAWASAEQRMASREIRQEAV